MFKSEIIATEAGWKKSGEVMEIRKTGSERIINLLSVKRIGTQRLYGHNGAMLIAEDWDGTLYIISATVMPGFAKVVKKVLPRNNWMPSDRGVSIQWSERDVWADAIDSYIERRIK